MYCAAHTRRTPTCQGCVTANAYAKRAYTAALATGAVLPRSPADPFRVRVLALTEVMTVPMIARACDTADLTITRIKDGRRGWVCGHTAQAIDRLWRAATASTDSLYRAEVLSGCRAPDWPADQIRPQMQALSELCPVSVISTVTGVTRRTLYEIATATWVTDRVARPVSRMWRKYRYVPPTNRPLGVDGSWGQGYRSGQ